MLHSFATMDINNNPCFTLSLLFICFCARTHLSLGATDRISADQSLCCDETIVSAGGVFELGFFKPGQYPNYYLGIWYSKVFQPTVVWVANREKSVTDIYSSELRISDGNLVLFDESKIPVWSTNLSSVSSSSVEAILLDEGNLVLRDGSNLLEPLWQGFDHPTDTWLPGAKLGLNKITGKKTRLISWKNAEDPAEGLFSLELDPNVTDQYILLFNMSQQYWSSGQWNGQNFSLGSEMRVNYIYNDTYVNNDKESYFTYFLHNNSIIFRFVLDVGGQIQQLSEQLDLLWSQPTMKCEVYAYCGPFGSCNGNLGPYCQCLEGFYPKFRRDWDSLVYSSGCVRKSSLQCGSSSLVSGKSYRFLERHNMVLPTNPLTVGVWSAKECESTCLSDCSCTAYAYDKSINCSIWIGDLLNLRQFEDDSSGGYTLYIKLAVYEAKLIVELSVFSGVIVALSAFVLFVIFKRTNRVIKTGEEAEGFLKAFSYRELRNVTKNFSEKLGEGGFGSVFKGTLPDSSVIAVKKLESISQGDKQFRSEVSTIGTIQHLNLVRLRGFCSEENRKLLVYDFMPNGSLDRYLFQGNESFPWKTRYEIALGTARGLAYLHEKCRDCIIHCDIKPENILLDAEFCPKVADFGMAKFFQRDFSRVLTTMRGTIGYLAPEWISGEAITAKADVYSYGMMLLELVSGKRNSEQSKDAKMEYFPIRVARLINNGGDVLSLLDPGLEGNANVEELTRVCKVGCWCIQDEETQRPSMGEVVYILDGVLDMNLPPIPRTLQELSWKPGNSS